jgi:hypothetical protein
VLFALGRQLAGFRVNREPNECVRIVAAEREVEQGVAILSAADGKVIDADFLFLVVMANWESLDEQ